MMRQVRFEEFGPAVDVLRVVDLERAEVPDDAVRADILAAPIHPADLNTIEGKYPILRKPPGVPGIEAVGVVREVGANAPSSLLGRRVLFVNRLGLWSTEHVAPAASVYAIPDDVPMRQAAMIKTNPATAWRLLHDFATLEPGDWVIQNAANSAAGLSVIQIARELGLRTINLVRRADVFEDLRRLGADATLLDDDDVASAVQRLTGKRGCALAINAVGGRSSLRLGLALRPRGVMVTIGAMALEPANLPVSRLVFNDITARGFWMYRWYETAPRADVEAMFAALIDLVHGGKLEIPVEAEYVIDDVHAAAAHAMREHRRGKILLVGSR